MIHFLRIHRSFYEDSSSCWFYLDKEVYKNKLLEIKNTYRSHLRAYHIDAYEKAGMPLPEEFEETFEVGFPGHLQVGVAISGCLMYGIHGMAGDYDVYNPCSQNDLSDHPTSMDNL